MATLSFPLGLTADHEFWKGAPLAWIAKQAWALKAFAKDYHVD